jgi:hypothetical protein
MRFLLVGLVLLVLGGCRTTITVEQGGTVVVPGPEPVVVAPDE